MSELTNDISQHFSRNWWLLALRGAVAIVFGLLAFAVPGLTLISLVWLFGAYAVVHGVLAFILAFRRGEGAGHLWMLIGGGIVSIIAGGLAFALPGLTALSLLYLIGAWAIVTGVAEIVAAVRLRKEISNEWLLILAGIASVLFGIAVIVLPGTGALALVWLIGAYALAFGVLLIALAFRMRSAGAALADATSAPPRHPPTGSSPRPA